MADAAGKGTKRRKSGGGGEPDGKRKQQTLLTAFARIRAPDAKPKPVAATSAMLVDLTNTTDSEPHQPSGKGAAAPAGAGTSGAAAAAAATSGKGPAASSAARQSTSVVSDSYIQFGQQPSVSHVSDSYKPRSRQGSHAGMAPAGGGGSGGAAADDVSSPQLSEDQARVAQLVRERKNVFFTGNAGTGKTFLLNRIIEELRARYGREFSAKVALAAPTGIAATHIQGTTINSALGLGAPQTTKDFLVMQKRETRQRVRQWEVLVLDEVSMLSAEFFQHMEAQLRAIRGNHNAAGGLQLVMCGDFFQLPPVTKRWVPGTPADTFCNWGYAFQAPAWKTAGVQHVLLTKVFRQQDNTFVQLLDDIRFGRNVLPALRVLRERCMRPLPATHGIQPTQLYSRNKEVDETNEGELAKLPSYAITLSGFDDVQPDPELASDPVAVRQASERLQRNEFFRDCLAAKDIKVKVGAQVLLLKNVDLEGGPNASRQLVNGSRGVVTSLVTREEVMKKLEADKKAMGGDDNGRLARLDPKAAAKLNAVMRQLDAMRSWSGRELPMVRFRNGAEVPVLPATFSSSVPTLGECRRVQVPLKLAWALTIHKCQGLTLDLVQVSLKDCFAQGQAYVALSRARSMEGLQLLDWSETCVKTDPAVSAFYASLAKGEEPGAGDNAWERWQAARAAAGASPGPSPGAGFGMRGGTAASSQAYQSQARPPPAAAGGRALPASLTGGGSQGFGGGVAGYGAGGYGAAGGAAGRSRAGDACFHCHQTGHWSRNCPNKQNRGGGNAPGQGQGGAGGGGGYQQGAVGGGYGPPGSQTWGR